jgi:hypothetical protein
MSQNQIQLWAKQGMGCKQCYKCQKSWPAMGQNDNQLWAEIGIGFKQYHKGQKMDLGQQLDQQ